MIVLVGSEDEQRVALVDAVGGQPVEERAERVVVALQRGNVTGLAGAVSAAAGVVVMDVRDVRVGDGHAGLERLRDEAERVGGRHAVEAREAAARRRGTLDRLAVDVIDAGIAAGDRRVDVLRAEERLVAAVAIRLVGQQVGLGVGVIGAHAGLCLGAVDGNADEVGRALAGSLAGLR